MKKRSFKFFIKQKQIAIDKLLAQIASINKEIEEIEYNIKTQNDRLKAIEQLKDETIFSLQNKDKIEKEIRNTIKEYLSNKHELEARIEELKAKLLETNSEKKALQKLLQKQEETEHYKQTQRENELANESYLRKNYISK